MFTVLLALALAATSTPVAKDSDPEAPRPQDDFIASLVAPNARDSATVKLQKDRARQCAIYIEQNRVTKDWNHIYFGEHLRAVWSLWENLEQLTTRPEEKVKCHKMRVEFAKEFEEIIKIRVKVGIDAPQYLNVARAARIDAEVALLTLKAALKSADPDPKESRPREDQNVKLDPYIAKLVEPEASDSAVLKLQKERVRERAIYLAKMQEVIKSGIWTAANFGDYIKEQRTFWEQLPGLASKPEDKLKCAEMRVEATKEFEKFIGIRVNEAGEPMQALNFAKAARLDAEIDLLKLKEALKAGK
jgi:hypothetical protein